MSEEQDYQTGPDGIVRLGALRGQRTTQTPEEQREQADFERLLAMRRAAAATEEDDELARLMAEPDEDEPDDAPADAAPPPPVRAQPRDGWTPEMHEKLDRALARLDKRT